ncbi:MAG: hypothetical protein A2496_09090 [Burkholderiales bacterium RIFOXYC12_FULL_60_6]|nr:MAG: hypothetical protein A2496_09090 [Burkholderiales bacterium RIFOXYC12_FULL_60_6]
MGLTRTQLRVDVVLSAKAEQVFQCKVQNTSAKPAEKSMKMQHNFKNMNPFNFGETCATNES